MQITATLINLYHVCKRELWLHAQGVRMEHTSDTVADANLLHEISYPQRASRYTELDLGIAKIDFYDAKNKVVHEIKRSNKVEDAHIWQVKYYLYLLKQAGVEATGILEYPKLRKTDKVFLEEGDVEEIRKIEKDILQILSQAQAPERRNKAFCKSCSYFELCWVE